MLDNGEWGAGRVEGEARRKAGDVVDTGDGRPKRKNDSGDRKLRVLDEDPGITEWL